MEPKMKRKNIMLSTIWAVLLLLFLVAGGFCFAGYLRVQIARERTSQLVEITSQIRLNLSNALDTRESWLTASVNALETVDFASGEDMVRRIGELERIFEMREGGARLILLDGQGGCYGADQKYGMWPEFKSLSWDKHRNIFIYEGRYWVFVRELSTPIRTSEDNLSFNHAVLFQDVQAMTQYYDSAAYTSHNEIHVLKSDGTRMYDYGQEKLLQAYNILNALETMEGQSCTDIRGALAETDTIGGRFRYDGKAYFYGVTSLEKQDTLLLFLIPAEYVASETVDMVGTVIRLLLILAAGLLFLAVLTAAAVLRQRGSVRLIRQEQANLRRQEELYAELEASTARLQESYTQLSVAKTAAEQAFQIAEEANRAKSLFLSNMSHDIRTPMNAIIGFLTLMRNEADNPEAVLEYVKNIDAASQHLLGLINNVLDMSKIESGSVTLNMEEINLKEIIDEMETIIRPQAQEKNQSFEIRIVRLTYENLIGDKLRINQVLINLLSNALKYTPEKGAIQLRIEELPQGNVNCSRIRFTVSDNGMGMSEEFLKVIFNPFTREQTTTTSGIQGSGLGMAITKNLVELMGGTIRAESHPGKGSTFTVELELRIQEQKEQENKKDEEMNVVQGMHVLVVDDVKVNQMILVKILSLLKADCDTASNGQEAVEKFEASQPGEYDLILMDVQMPVMDGYAATRAIRSSSHPSAGTVMIIAITANAFVDDVRNALESGMDAHIAKPVRVDNLKAAIGQVMDSRKATT